MNRNRDGIMTGAIVFIVIALAAILLLHDSGVDMGNSMFMSYVDVVLTSDGGETRRLLAVAYTEYTKAIDPFEPDAMRAYVTSDDAYLAETHEDKSVTNTLRDARLFDESGAEIEADPRMRALLEAAQGIDGAIRRVKIFSVKDQLFAQVTVYVGAWETNALYHFVDDDTKLRHLGSFPGEEVVGLRLTPALGG